MLKPITIVFMLIFRNLQMDPFAPRLNYMVTYAAP